MIDYALYSLYCVFENPTSIQMQINPLFWCEELTLWKRAWWWERLKAGGDGDDWGWGGWIASPTQWTWVWASSKSWWWTGKPGVLRFMGSQSQTQLSHWTDWLAASNREGTAREGGLWKASCQKLDNDSNSARTPVPEATGIPAHLALPGSLPSKQPCYLHAWSSLGQSCQRVEKTLTVPYLLCPWSPAPLSTWCCQGPCDLSSCNTSTPGPH